MTAPFDRIVESTDATMVIVTASADGRDAGCLVGFHCQSSMEPPRWTVWISKANHTYPVVRRAENVGVHFLTEHDRSLAEIFGSKTGNEDDKFARCETVRRAGTPMLSRCEHWFVGSRVGLHDDGGDHVGITIEPVSIGSPGRFEPLHLMAVDDLEPGHRADEGPARGAGSEVDP